MELTLRGSNVHDTNTFSFFDLSGLATMVTHFHLQKNMLSVICNTKNHSNNRKRHTNRHLQGRLCDLVQILTSDVVMTSRFCAESCQLTNNNNKTPGSDIFCKELFFCVGLSISKSQTDSSPCFRHKVLLLSSCRLLVLTPALPRPFPPLLV